MNKFSLRQIVIPLITLAIIGFMYFGPIIRTAFENIIIAIIIIIANYIEYKGKPFSALGFKRENFNAKNLLVHAPLVALGLFIFYVIAVVPGIEMLTGVPIDYSSMSQLEGNLEVTIVWLLIVWATAGFGEEIIFRGYLMQQFIKFFGDSKLSLAINILLICSFFGYMHMQQGITGQLVVMIIGALLSIIFYLRKYDLWFLIMIHGFFNTLGILSFYFGLA
ncbi:CPBP family intramembrane metalloprotease [Weeksellaceae bacterium KMM 9724]|uniref:CPBP family intramembrane glutamic endopeptidase n=1 Tax=Profundicola chukchiensis TaxID=2961959 RepID=UPI00243F8261|nr:CPBP family intramembrane glutamic endopeptidase [Profundicola chukchiensis]MDG4950745.1 CPBP family intramembrane metalloprotease [Profundicola chukchiensis]